MTQDHGAPIEWLIGLRERPEGYRRLFEEAGSLSIAAWRLARARCLASHRSTGVPSRMEVRAAAHELTAHVSPGTRVPPSAALASECESVGLLVV